MSITSKPDYGTPLIESNLHSAYVFQIFLDDIERLLNQVLAAVEVLQQTVQSDRIQSFTYTVATLPSPGDAGGAIYVSDEAGGGIPAFSDGVNWRRVTDRAIVS